jgi:hypothetical protein
MPVAERFTSLGRGNGFPFCVQHSTDSIITAFDGHEDKLSAAPTTIVEKYRVIEVTLTEAMNFIWNLYSVDFASSGGNTFTNPGILRYNDTVTEGYINAVSYTPKQRVCNEELELTIPRAINVTGGIGWFVAETVGDDFPAQFAIRAIYRATDTGKYYMIFTRSIRADDGSFSGEIPFANLTFNYYTYS